MDNAVSKINSIASILAHAKTKIDAIDAEALLAHILEKDRSYFRTWPEREIEKCPLKQFQQLVNRRVNGEPLAYLTGWREFWSLLLQVSPATLIPRPETEQLVEQALNRIPTEAHWHIADLGTGSGAIALAIASERPNCHVVATDISADALAVAQANAQRLDINNITFRQGNWHTALNTEKQFQLIASNPPYIDANDKHLQHDGLPHEPQNALTPGSDGLTAIRIIIKQMKNHLCQPGWILLEHGYNQGQAVRDLLNQQNYSETHTLKDPGNNERLSIARKIS